MKQIAKGIMTKRQVMQKAKGLKTEQQLDKGVHG